MTITRKNRSPSNLVEIFSIILSICCSFLVAIVFLYDVFPQLRLGEIDPTSIITIAVGAIGCAVCAYLGKGSLKNKKWREIYFAYTLVPTFSIISYIFLGAILKLDFSIESLVSIWLTISILVSCIFAKQPLKAFLDHLIKLFWKKGLLYLIVFLIAFSASNFLQETEIIRFDGQLEYPGVASEQRNAATTVISASGYIEYPNTVLEQRNSTTKLEE